MPYGVHERLRSHRGVDLTGKPRDLAFACYQYKVNAEDCQGKAYIQNKSYERGNGLGECETGDAGAATTETSKSAFSILRAFFASSQ